ncbi:MAG: sensor histidine kinase [Caldilineaceae bacterium]
MTGIFLLDWALMAVSLINVILISWLGLTVLLNAERRAWGVWLAGGGLLLGAAFFVSHTAILGLGPDFASRGLEWWWRAGWVPLVALPFAWYAIIAWYTGFLDVAQEPPPAILAQRRQHRFWFFVTLGLCVALVGLLLFTSPLPTFSQAAQLNLSTSIQIGGLPLILLTYPLYILLCIGLSLSALRTPMPSGRMMGDLARRRARPWLIAASSLLLVVSLLVGGLIGWAIRTAQSANLDYRVVATVSNTVALWDLVIALLILGAVYMVGQAIVAYEIFTGQTLPRGELRRHWLNAILLALGFGSVVGLAFALQLRPIYSLLMATVLLIFFYALLGWRSYTRREEYIRQLRPFLGSQHLYERLLYLPDGDTKVSNPLETGWPAQPPPTVDVSTLFATLCRDVLNVRRAYLIAIGPLAPLVGPSLCYPERQDFPAVAFGPLAAQFSRPETICLPLDPAVTDGFLWAVPLWSERGLIGIFLLGAKQNDGLYTQEEIEIARASGERLIDTRASAELARSLMLLQRQRLAESQLLDRRTRRVLHDDILPQVHTALIALGGDGASAIPNATTVLMDVHRQIADLLREMPARSTPAVARMGLIAALHHLIADELPEAFDDVAWIVEEKAEKRLQQLAHLTVEVLFYAAREAIRNAARYGRGDRANQPLHLQISICDQSGLVVKVRDDGVGVQSIGEKPQGSQQGLELHRTMLAVVGGTLAVTSSAGEYTQVTLRLPAYEATELQNGGAKRV